MDFLGRAEQDPSLSTVASAKTRISGLGFYHVRGWGWGQNVDAGGWDLNGVNFQKKINKKKVGCFNQLAQLWSKTKRGRVGLRCYQKTFKE